MVICKITMSRPSCNKFSWQILLHLDLLGSFSASGPLFHMTYLVQYQGIHFFSFFHSCLICICNPVGYDKPESIFTYKEKPSLTLCLLSVHFSVVSPYLLHKLWENFPLLNLAPIDLVSLLATFLPLGHPYTSIPTPVFLSFFLYPP